MVYYQYLTTNQVLLLYFPLDMHAGRVRPFRYTLFCEISTFMNVRSAFVFGLQTL